MNKFLLLTIYLVFSLNCLAEDPQLVSLHSYEDYFRFNFKVSGPSMNNGHLPLFIFASPKRNLNKNSQVILFLHGRGYSRDYDVKGSMLEHLGIKDLLIKNPQLIFMAPQDTFLHPDSDSRGQDYWLGRDARNWPQFLGVDLPIQFKKIQKILSIKGELNSVMGISMGAHGALLLGERFPERYKSIIALSPVFRSIPSEIPQTDNDVFLESALGGMEDVNIGSKLINNHFFLSQRTFIEISKNDFALDEVKFPTAKRAWNNLLRQSSKQASIVISENEDGHSGNYWKEAIPRAINYIDENK